VALLSEMFRELTPQIVAAAVLCNPHHAIGAISR
jgi:hypothetical protein